MPGRKMKIGIVGLGMVGGTIYRWLEEREKYVRGYNLFCYDKNKRLGYNDNVNQADLIVVCVPTPMIYDGSEYGKCDTSIVEDVVDSIHPGKIVVIKSTVVPGTTASLALKYPDKEFLFSPEYLTEGQPWEDFTGKCGRQIVAHFADGEKSSINHAKQFLEILPWTMVMMPSRGVYENLEDEIEVTEAELAKYFANMFGAMKVLLDNIFKDIADGLNISFYEQGEDIRVRHERVERCVGLDPRIGSGWLNVDHGDYRGIGGYCFPKDFAAMLYLKHDLRVVLEKFNETANNSTITMLIVRLDLGYKALSAFWTYNETLLNQQGTSVREVSKHDEELKKKLKKLKKLSPIL
jgi:UDPglucose 6-dehydrogenase